MDRVVVGVGGSPFSCPRSRPGPRAVGTDGMEGHRAPCVWMGGAGRGDSLVGCGEGGRLRARLAVRVPEAAPPTCPLPQAEAAGNLEVVSLLQSLQAGGDGQALGSVSPSATVTEPWFGERVMGTELEEAERVKVSGAPGAPPCGRGTHCRDLNAAGRASWREGQPQTVLSGCP